LRDHLLWVKVGQQGSILFSSATWFNIAVAIVATIRGSLEAEVTSVATGPKVRTASGM
jgi:hypothetical protein